MHKAQREEHADNYSECDPDPIRYPINYSVAQQPLRDALNAVDAALALSSPPSANDLLSKREHEWRMQGVIRIIDAGKIFGTGPAPPGDGGREDALTGGHSCLPGGCRRLSPLLDKGIVQLLAIPAVRSATTLSAAALN